MAIVAMIEELAYRWFVEEEGPGRETGDTTRRGRNPEHPGCAGRWASRLTTKTRTKSEIGMRT